MSQLVNPDDYIITRKRKKYRFAKFANAANCFELDEWPLQPIDIVEIGAGTGLFSLELARRHPDMTFVALDVKADRLQKGAYLALESGIDNIYFIRARADQLGQVASPRSVRSIWITFPDPFLRKRSAGRRLTHENYLKTYSDILTADGNLYLKHDSQDFFCWSLEQLVQTGWQLRELSFDLHESDLVDDYKVMTTYEERWIGEGIATKFVRASRS